MPKSWRNGACRPSTSLAPGSANWPANDFAEDFFELSELSVETSSVISPEPADSSQRDAGERISVAEALVRAFESEDIRHVFGLDDPQPVFASLRKSSIGVVIAHDERSGGFMADGYYRAGGAVPLCAGISGPGATNLITPLLEA